MCMCFLLVASVSQKYLTAAPWPGRGVALAGSGDVPIFLLDCTRLRCVYALMGVTTPAVSEAVTLLLCSIPKDMLLVIATPVDKKEAEQYFPPACYFNASKI